MKVKLTYFDNSSFTIEEVVRQAKINYGNKCLVEVYPDSNSPQDILYFALQQLVTQDQLSLLYTSEDSYPKDLEKLIDNVNKISEDTLHHVITDNEIKVGD